MYSKGKMPLKSGINWAPDRSDFGEGVFIFLRFGGFKNPWGGFIILRFPQILGRGVFIKGGGVLILIARYIFTLSNRFHQILSATS